LEEGECSGSNPNPALRGQEVRGQLTETGRGALEVEEPGSLETVRPEPAGESLVHKLREFEIDIVAESAESPSWQQLLVRALLLLEPFHPFRVVMVWPVQSDHSGISCAAGWVAPSRKPEITVRRMIGMACIKTSSCQQGSRLGRVLSHCFVGTIQHNLSVVASC